MALPASAISSSISPVTSFNNRLSQFHRPLFLHVRPSRTSTTTKVKLLPRMQQFQLPPELNIYFTCTKEKLLESSPDAVKQFPWKEAKSVVQQKLWESTPDAVKQFPWKEAKSVVQQKLWESTPDAVKQFPWKEAKSVALQKFLVYGKEALKWSLIASLIYSFASDVLYSISKNKELLIPFGLFVGCLMTNYLNEVSQELLNDNKEKGMTWQPLGIFCFFIFVNAISVYFPVGGRVFLLHVANGGLMQVLWHWRSLWQQDTDERGEIHG